jgi:hypothetical protein
MYTAWLAVLVVLVRVDLVHASGWLSVRLAYQPPVSSTFLSEQISHQQLVNSTFLSAQIRTSHQPPPKRTGRVSNLTDVIVPLRSYM